MPVIDTKATGANIKAIMKEKGFKIDYTNHRIPFDITVVIFTIYKISKVPMVRCI